MTGKSQVCQSKIVDRFGGSNNVLIESLKENAKNKNTQQNTNNLAAKKGGDLSIESYEPKALNKILEDFYATARKEDGQDYEPISLRGMITAIDRYLTEKGCRHGKIRD